MRLNHRALRRHERGRRVENGDAGKRRSDASAAAGFARHIQAAAEGPRPVHQSNQSRAVSGIGSAHAIIDDFHDEVPGRVRQRHVDTGCMRVLHDVGERFSHDEIRGCLDRRVEAGGEA